jgi:oxygen-independent coproporphyrinogen-3 oxidase
MGVQTTDFTLAQRLGREDADYLTKARDNIRAAGFESFNVDLMYGFPLRTGTEDKWADTVSNAINVIDPDHITLYRMRYKGTKMAHLQERVGLQQVNEQSDTAARILQSYGFSGWVGKNTFSRLANDSGCSDYLEKRVVAGIPYLGFGLGAQSFSHNTLSYNLGGVTKRMEQYFKSIDLGRVPVQDLYHLSIEGAMGKFCSVSFYFGGINRLHFLEIFGRTLEEAFPSQVAFVLEEGLMEYFGDRLQMTVKGKMHYGGVLALFYAPHIQRHLLELPGGEVNSTAYMSPTKLAPISFKPYIGNPKGRYEKKKRKVKRHDPRPSLSGDWQCPVHQLEA